MGEINNTGEEEVINQAENGDDNQDESQKDVQEEEKGNSDQIDQEEQSNEEDKTDSDEKPALADEEPKTRKRNIDFILERKNRKIEKLQEKVETEEDEEDDFVDPDAQKLVQKEIQKALSPFLQKQIEEEDNNEINSFLQENPDFKPYADKVRKFAQHESRKHLPIKSIFYEVAGPDLLKIGADRAKRAGDEAKESNAGGGSGDTSTAEKGVWELTPEEFAAKQEEIRNRPRP